MLGLDLTCIYIFVMVNIGILAGVGSVYLR